MRKADTLLRACFPGSQGWRLRAVRSDGEGAFQHPVCQAERTGLPYCQE